MKFSTEAGGGDESEDNVPGRGIRVAQEKNN